MSSIRGSSLSANKWLKNWLPSILSRLLLGGAECQENHFYSLPFGQAEASIILAQKAFQQAELISQFFFILNSSKNITCLSGKLRA